MSPDWSVQEEPVPYAKLDNPQSLNLYGYVLNNPLSMFDADGHDGWWSSFGGGLADSTYRPLVQMASHPGEALSGIVSAAAHPINTVVAAKNVVIATGKAALSGDGAAIGVAVGTVGMAFIPGAEEAEAGENLSRAARLGELTAEGAEEFGMLREAAQTKGMFGMGTADTATANKLGEAWAGAGAK